MWSGGPFSKRFPERRAAEMIAEGVLRLDVDGSVWRLRKYQPGMTESWPVTPKRIDYPTKRGNRYFEINLGPLQPCKVQVSRLVWQVHKGDIPPMMTVNHKDGDPTNDAIDNLELATHQEQHLHRYHVLGHKSPARVNKELADQLALGARAALSGDPGPLREALRAYDDWQAALAPTRPKATIDRGPTEYPRTVMTDEKLDVLRAEHAKGTSQRDIARMLGVSPQLVNIHIKRLF